MWTLLLRNWFIFGVSLSVLFAWINPKLGSKGGYLKPEITVKYFAVVMIFFISGLSLRSEDMSRTIFRYHIHIFIQSFTLILVPTLVYAFVIILRELGFSEGLRRGFLVVSCMPPPVSSAIILTKSAGGNEAIAVFNSALGSFLGIIITPCLLIITIGSSTMLPVRKTIIQLMATIVLPLVIGQCIRHYLVTWIHRNKNKLSTIGSCMLLLIIYMAFCDTLSQEKNQLQSSTIVITVIIVIFLQASLMYIVMNLSSLVNQCSPSDSIAIMFCATHKSLTLGIPMLKILYDGDPQLTEIIFPLLVYHPTQILFGSFLIPYVRKWIRLEWTKDKLLDV